MNIPSVAKVQPVQIAQRYTPSLVIVAPTTIAAGATVNVVCILNTVQRSARVSNIYHPGLKYVRLL